MVWGILYSMVWYGVYYIVWYGMGYGVVYIGLSGLWTSLMFYYHYNNILTIKQLSCRMCVGMACNSRQTILDNKFI